MKHHFLVSKLSFGSLILIFAAMTAHCSGPQNPTTKTETNFLATSTAISISTETDLPKISSTLPMSETTTSTAISRTSRLFTNCIDVLNNESFNHGQFKGTLVLNEINGPAYLLNLETGKKAFLPEAFRTAVSPDRSKLAYDGIHGDVIISDKYGNQLKSISDTQQRLFPAQWLDNVRLVLSESRTRKGGSFVLDSLIVMDLSTGEKRELLPDYPDINYFFPPAFQWEGYYLSRIVPDPTLHYLVYPTFGGKLVLWDVLLSREVRHVYGLDELGTPWWSPDGTRFITSAPVKITDSENKTYFNIDDGLPYKGGDDLFTVNQAGKTQRLTYLTTEYKAKEFHYSWSPDGQKIAFWLQLDENTDSQFAVANVNTGEVTNYCISTIDGGARTVWSKDGNQLALSPISGDQQTILIVDLQLNAAIKIAKNASVLGWMK